MGKRGPKPKGKVDIKWSSDFAYAIGLIASDGSLSKNGRHIVLSSREEEQLKNFQKALGIKVAIGYSTSHTYIGKKVARVQFGDVLFYEFLLKIGLMPNKSKIIGELKIPDKYFFDFLRGSFDGDGSTYSYFDPRWNSSFVFYTTFASASKDHIHWLRGIIYNFLNIKGHLVKSDRSGVYQLRYAKADSLVLLRKMYPKIDVTCLTRKRLKIENMLRTIGEHL